LPRRSSKLLIIFDLDDTLVDTSGTILPQRFRSALSKMEEEGLERGGLERLLEINRKSSSSAVALKTYFEETPRAEYWINRGKSLIYDEESFDFTVGTTPGAKEVLPILYQKHTLCLVTIGRADIQLAKVKKAGLEPGCFSTINVCNDGEKGAIYQMLIDKFGLPALVCGDRIERDLRPAKPLGITTVLMRWGRGWSESAIDPDVDYEINDLNELLELVKRHGT